MNNLNTNNRSRDEIGPVPFHPSTDEAVVFFEQILTGGMRLRVKVTGASMAPFLTGGELLTIKRVPLPSLKKGDLIFFKTSYGKPVLHRLVGKKLVGKEFVMQTQGDALACPDEPFMLAGFLGKACLVEKNSAGRPGLINLESPAWRTINYIAAMKNLVKSQRLVKILKRCFMIIELCG